MEPRAELTDIGNTIRPGAPQPAPTRAAAEEELLLDHHIVEVLAALRAAAALRTADPEHHR